MGGGYDTWLVILSIAVAMIAPYAAIDLALRMKSARETRVQHYWLAAGAAALGVGIWSTHFVGMLALNLPIRVSYDASITLVSLGVALVACALSLHVVDRGMLNPLRLIGAGILLGAGMTATHSIGMGAMLVDPPMIQEYEAIAVSLVVTSSASVGALWLAFSSYRERPHSAFWGRLAGALILGTAISGMHYAEMAALVFPRQGIGSLRPHDVSNVWLAVAIGGFTFLSLATTLIISLFDARLADRSARQAKELSAMNASFAQQAAERARAIALLQEEARERRRVEAALRASEASHRLLAEYSSDMISRLNPRGVLEYASPASATVLGYAPAELVGRTAAEFIHPDDREQAVRLFGEAAARRTVKVVTCRLRRRDGGWIWVETSFRGIPGDDSEPLRVIGISRDVDERVRVAEALERFQKVLDSTLDMIMMFDAETLHFTYVNRGAADALGYTREQMLRMPPWRIRVGVGEDEYRRSLAPFLRGEIEVRHAETVYVRADGSELPVEATLQLVRRPGEHSMFIAVARDATERRKVERMKSEFVATVSHELRTPLTSIRGSLGLMAGGAVGELSQEARELVRIAYNNSERLARLINDILDMEKIESGKMRFDIQPHPLRPLLEQALDANRAYGEQLSVRFETRGEIPEVAVLADADRFMQVMSNLLSNAAKFSPAGGSVEVSAQAAAGVVSICVSDHGSGIPEAFRGKIFGKFSQADANDSRRKGGTGLGLSIVKAIVEGHGGRVGFESTLGSGTTFQVSFPHAPLQPHPGAFAVPREGGAAAATAFGSEPPAADARVLAAIGAQAGNPDERA